ncbi:MAG: ABC transporter permease [Candidatus Sumerlaeia bacterium]
MDPVVILIAFVIQAVRISTPYVFASVGGVFCERGGVVNIALEGILLTAAFGCVAGAFWGVEALGLEPQKAAWMGVGTGIAGGLAMGLLLAVTAVTFKGDQIIAGLAINIFAAGFTKMFCDVLFDSPSNSPRIPVLEAPEWLSGGPLAGAAMLAHPLILLAAAIVGVSAIVLGRTRFGLRLRAVGENPEAADTLGIPVAGYRFAGVLIGSGVAALGGVWLATAQGLFSAGMSGGRGYIALAALIVGKWRPAGAALACLLFGAAEALQIHLQTRGITAIPAQFLQMLPYLLTILILAGFIGRAIPPAADGRPYEKEQFD